MRLSVKSARVLLEALDCLGLSLAKHGHRWTERERGLYESSVAMLQGGSVASMDHETTNP
jgi:hypothetical protein